MTAMRSITFDIRFEVAFGIHSKRGPHEIPDVWNPSRLSTSFRRGSKTRGETKLIILLETEMHRIRVPDWQVPKIQAFGTETDVSLVVGR